MDGSLKWAVDVKLPGMVHARNVKPPVAGAKLVSIDESSVSELPGFVKVVSKGNYVAVVCEREEQAIRAARQLKVNWQKPATRAVPGLGGSVHVHAQRDAHVERPPTVVGQPRRGVRRRGQGGRGRIRRAVPGHTSIGPAHAMADPSNDQMTIYSNDMKSYGLRNGVAQFLQMPRDRVRVVWMDGPQALRPHGGRRCRVRGGVSGEGDRPPGARAVDAPGGDRLGHQGAGVRLQDARRARRAGQPVALDYEARAADHNHLGYNEADTVLIAQLTGQREPTPARGSAAAPSDMYVIPNRRIGHARRRPAARVGDAAAHRQPARSRTVRR